MALLVAAGFYYGGEYATLDFVKQKQQDVADYYDKNPALLLGGFFVAYVAVTGLSLPGAALMTLLAGAIFGVLVGTVLVSFASSIGATLAFLVARFCSATPCKTNTATNSKRLTTASNARENSTCSQCASSPPSRSSSSTF